MFPKTVKTTTNAGEKTTANVSKKRQSDNKRRKFSRKCGQKQTNRQQTPEKNLPKMFLKLCSNASANVDYLLLSEP